MNLISKMLLIFFYLFGFRVLAQEIVLDSNRNLSYDELYKIAYLDAEVTISSNAMQKVKNGFDVVMNAALSGQKVYGLTVGVGWNKDKPIFKEVDGKKVLSDELLELSRKFNKSSLRAHSSGLGDILPKHIVRAAMAIRLNTFLNGEAGVSPDLVKTYVSYLNESITPQVPSRGSVGEADITLASHIGLAMIGEWKVEYKGNIINSSEVMRELGIKPLDPIGKDFLSILSNNSIMAALAFDSLLRSQRLYENVVKIFALSIEGLNGNIAPFSLYALEKRPYEHVKSASKDILEALDGSDLFKLSGSRHLQDPLSFRSMGYTLGEVKLAISNLKKDLLIHINHTDDNPLVLIDGIPAEEISEQLSNYKIKEHNSAIIPTSNFNFLPVTRSVSQLNEALAKLSEVITQQIIRFENPEITKLSRFLAAKSNFHGHAFGAIQKPFVSANQEIKQLAAPQWFSGVVVAGNIEDTASMSELTIRNSHSIIDRLYEIMSFQLLHSAQAVELREGFRLSTSSNNLLENYRKTVPFFDVDRETTSAVMAGVKFLKSYQQ